VIAATVGADRADRVVHVEHCMGTAFTIDVRDDGCWDDAIRDVVEWLHRVDAIFSTYRADSDISRIRDASMHVLDAAPEVAEVLDLCTRVQAVTRGYFSAYWRDGTLDPTGLVKGWAIERASERLRRHGSANHAVNGGGDLQLAGEAAPGRPWRVGIVDPRDRHRLIADVEGSDIAVATSGTAERGAHIVDPRRGVAADALASVTVIGRSLTFVDAYATAAFAMGADAYAWIEALPDHDGIVVAGSGGVRRTNGRERPAMEL
jgi:thiamine biosynthesis lipoprotein